MVDIYDKHNVLILQVPGELRGADLRGVKLKGADLEGADLSGADLTEARLNGANLENAVLTGAILRRAKLTHASLLYASLQGADLDGADITGSLFGSAQLEGACMRGCRGSVRFDSANLDGVQASDADFSSSSLFYASFRCADLRRVCFEDAFCCDVTFAGADLRHAKFDPRPCRSLGDVDLSGCDLRGANLEGLTPASCYFKQARYSSSTILPAGFDPRRSGMILLQDD